MEKIAIITNKMVMESIDKSLISMLEEFNSKDFNTDLHIKRL